MSQATPVKIIDVRLDSEASQATSAIPLRSAILAGLNNPSGKKSLPTALLYDEQGLRLYDLITTDAPEYYLFPLEEAILRTKGAEIITAIHGEKGLVDGEVFLELGAGSLRKTSHLLHNLAALVDKKRPLEPMAIPPATYYALDLERCELERTLNQIAMTKDVSSVPPASETGEHPYGALGEELSGRVAVRGIWGTYDGGIQFINQNGLEKLRTADLAEAESDNKPAQERASASTDNNANANINVNTVFSSNSSSSEPSSKSQSDSGSGSSGTTPPSPISSSPLPDDKYAQSTDAAAPPARTTPLHLLFLGSSLGNFSRKEMVGFLSRLPLRPGSGDTLLIGLDGDNGKERIEKAYNDAKGITKDFIMNGLRVAGLTLGNESLFTQSKWEYVNFYNEAERRHEAYYKSVGPQSVKIPSANLKDTEAIVNFEDGELVNIEVSHKFSTNNILELFSLSNLRIIQQWKDPQDLYGLYLVERPAFHFSLVKELPLAGSTPGKWDVATLLDEPNDNLSPYSIPTIKDWNEMWKAWDTITLGMIPPSMLHQKPIDLRHKCLFYLGHIPTFLDIHLSRLLKEPHTEPDCYKYIFERGIDPHVDDPTQCHPHSEVPDKDEDWPTLEEILDFRDRVRKRLLNVYADLKSGKRVLDRKTVRVLFMTFEHEALHAETLLYMLIQRAGSGTLPPPSFAQPAFESLKEQWDKDYQEFYNSSASGAVLIPSGAVVLGHDDVEAEDATVPFDPRHDFGWDNEHPSRTVQLPSFRISWRPITNGEYFAHWSDPEKNKGEDEIKMPASWVTTASGATCVRTLYGPVGFDIAKHWPVQAEYDDLSTYARVKGGRIPTVAELQAFWEKYQGGFVGSANVGFRNWHPVPATTGVKDGGQGHNGGVWEWTSTKLASYEGYVASTLYPGYSSDFFDDKHQVVIGGSYATVPRIAQRASVSNFYQHNYPYAWVGARIVYDA